MELENQEFDRWLKWAEQEVVTREQRSAAFSGAAPVTDDEVNQVLIEDSPDGPEETVSQYVKPDRGPYQTEQRPL